MVIYMFQLSPSHITAFETNQIDQFIEELGLLIEELSPPLAPTLSSQEKYDGAKEVYSIAVSQGFSKRGPIRFWLDLSLIFGIGFYCDPQYPWISRLLSETEGLAEMERAERMYEAVRAYMKDACGQQAILVWQALRNLRVKIDQPLSFDPTHLSDDFVALMKSIYPEKAARCGDGALKQLSEDTMHRARSVYAFSDPHALGLMVTLAFCFGHHFDRDPFKKWIGRTLAKSGSMSPNELAEKLKSRAVIWLDATLSKQSGVA